MVFGPKFIEPSGKVRRQHEPAIRGEIMQRIKGQPVAARRFGQTRFDPRRDGLWRGLFRHHRFNAGPNLVLGRGQKRRPQRIGQEMPDGQGRTHQREGEH